MININEYIIEKLHINKNSKYQLESDIESDINNLGRIEDIILDYLKEHNYFGYNHNDFNISKKQDPGNQKLYVFLIYKKKDFYNIAKKVGKEITNIIKDKLPGKWYWALNYIDAIIFSDTYIGGDL